MQDPPEPLFGHLQTGINHNMPVTPPLPVRRDHKHR